MSALFVSLAGLARGSVERIHGEEVTILPMDRPTGPNGKRHASTARAPWAVKALFYRDAEGVDRDMTSALARGGLGGGSAGLMRSGRHIASVGKGPAGQVPIEGDLVRREGDLAHFEITAADPDGLGHYTLTIATAKTPA